MLLTLVLLPGLASRSQGQTLNRGDLWAAELRRGPTLLLHAGYESSSQGQA